MTKSSPQKVRKRAHPNSLAALKRTQIKKGEVRNPNGGRTHNPAIKAIKRLSQEIFREVVEQVLTGNTQDLIEFINNPNTSAIQVGAAKAFKKAIDNSDWSTIRVMAAELVGKLPDEININSRNVNANIDLDDRAKVKAVLSKIEEEV